jgi:hypothetical protein
MDKASVALVLTCALWAVFGFCVWKMKRFMHSTGIQLRDLEHSLRNTRTDMITLSTLRMELDTVSRNAEARSKLVGLALADRIDALSARMDAVELAYGLREKAKTMGGQDG